MGIISSPSSSPRPLFKNLSITRSSRSASILVAKSHSGQVNFCGRNGWIQRESESVLDSMIYDAQWNGRDSDGQSEFKSPVTHLHPPNLLNYYSWFSSLFKCPPRVGITRNCSSEWMRNLGEIYAHDTWTTSRITSGTTTIQEEDHHPQSTPEMAKAAAEPTNFGGCSSAFSGFGIPEDKPENGCQGSLNATR